MGGSVTNAGYLVVRQPVHVWSLTNFTSLIKRLKDIWLYTKDGHILIGIKIKNWALMCLWSLMSRDSVAYILTSRRFQILPVRFKLETLKFSVNHWRQTVCWIKQMISSVYQGLRLYWNIKMLLKLNFVLLLNPVFNFWPWMILQDRDMLRLVFSTRFGSLKVWLLLKNSVSFVHPLLLYYVFLNEPIIVMKLLKGRQKCIIIVPLSWKVQKLSGGLPMLPAEFWNPVDWRHKE